MRSCICLVMMICLGSFTSAAPKPSSSSSAATKKLPGQLVHTMTANDKFKVQMRPAVSTLAPGDVFGVVVHFADKKGPLDPFAGHQKTDMLATVRSLKWTVQTPDDRTYQLIGSAKDGRTKWQRAVVPLGRAATHAFQIDHKGFRTIGPWGGIEGLWASDKPFPTFDKEGVYQISATGTLGIQGDPTRFKLPPIHIKVDKGVQSLAKALETAIAAQQKHVPNQKLMKHKQTESGYARDFVHEDTEGNRRIDLNVTNGQFRWGYDLVRVTVSPMGKVKRVQVREVFTCVAEGVMVATPTGPRAIESLKRGDRVWSFDTKNRKRVINTVETIRHGFAGETISFPGGLRVTTNHPVYANGNWQPAGRVVAHDTLLKLADDHAVQAIKPVSLKRTVSCVPVIDLTVAEPHNFFAGGLLVHNKDRAWSASLDDPWYFTWPTKPHKWKPVFDVKD